VKRLHRGRRSNPNRHQLDPAANRLRRGRPHRPPTEATRTARTEPFEPLDASRPRWIDCTAVDPTRTESPPADGPEPTALTRSPAVDRLHRGRHAPSIDHPTTKTPTSWSKDAHRVAAAQATPRPTGTSTARKPVVRTHRSHITFLPSTTPESPLDTRAEGVADAVAFASMPSPSRRCRRLRVDAVAAPKPSPRRSRRRRRATRVAVAAGRAPTRSSVEEPH